MAFDQKCVILRQTVAAKFSANPAWPGSLPFLRTALKPVHLTGRAGVGGLRLKGRSRRLFFMARQQCPGVKKAA